MAEVTYRPSKIAGSVQIPPSKSAAHRALLCAALCEDVCTVLPIDTSADMYATLNGVRAMGKNAEFTDGVVHITPGEPIAEPVVDCGESGSTLRFLIPIFAALGIPATFIGHGRLPERPIGVYTELLPQHGVRVETAVGLPLAISGKLESGDYRLPGNISSQFITGLLFALPLLPGDSTITLTTELESKGYIDLTIGVLRGFGVEIIETETGWAVPGGQKYKAESCTVEGDWSQAAFFLSLAAIGGGPVEMHGLTSGSLQGDKACVELWRRFGLQITEENGVLRAVNPHVDEPFRGLKGISIDAAQIPDMVPALAVTAAFAQGETVIYNAARLRIKESDRLSAMEEALNALGAEVTAKPDGLVIRGKAHLNGGKAEGKNDHRIVMALSAAGCDCTVTVTDAQSIRKSYPGFFRDLTAIGGIPDVIDMGK
ncbi:MAG: 3-phosphoshikimate 1-carboxyvinyltransferase [Clostridia bacterium]|nr:3-phosphoshikimate 1-carboxyvinyltransferase [Clostridia bacterium]